MWISIEESGLPPEPGFWKVMNHPMVNKFDQRLLFYREEIGWLECGTYNKADSNPTHYWSVIWEKAKIKK